MAAILSPLQCVDTCGVETGIFWDNYVKIMAPCSTETSIAIVLNMQDKQVLVVYGEGFRIQNSRNLLGNVKDKGTYVGSNAHHMIHFL